MFIDVMRGSEKVKIYLFNKHQIFKKIQVNIDITFYSMPCAMLSMDLQDVVGSHSMDLSGQVYKRRLDKNGKWLSDQLHVFIFSNYDKLPKIIIFRYPIMEIQMMNITSISTKLNKDF